MLGADGTPLSYNLYAYCMNNPVNRTDPDGYWSWGWKDALKAGAVVTIVAIVLVAIVATGGTAAPPLLAAASGYLVPAATAIAKGAAIGGAIALGGATIMEFAKKSKSSDKERSTDKPSWVNKSDVDMGKTAQQNASNLLNDKYGAGNWKTGANSEFNKIVKWINRGLKIILITMNRFEKE